MSRLEPVTGGLLHSMYRIRTTTGSFAVKVLDKGVVRTSEVRAEYRRSEAVAAKFAAAGVPAVFAMDGRQGKLSDIGVRSAMVYPWIDGVMMTQKSAGPHAAHRIGWIIAAMHRTEISQSSFNPPHPFTSSFGEWRQLVDSAKANDASWVAEIEEMVPDLMLWEFAAVEATEALGRNFVVSHRDLDQKNVLWTSKDEPAIVDWEGVGLVRPAVEVICAALDWSGQKLGAPDQATFKALLAGYRQLQPLSVEDCRYALLVLTGATGWLRANMRASVDADRSPDRRAQRSREIVQYAKSLQALANNVDTWTQWCEEPAKPVEAKAAPPAKSPTGTVVPTQPRGGMVNCPPRPSRPKTKRINIDLLP